MSHELRVWLFILFVVVTWFSFVHAFVTHVLLLYVAVCLLGKSYLECGFFFELC